mmetsp:Transcript_45358/g.145489  ORF Transcript_45358/g.145489 Transcript_45358/m.145489 type:complete len:622 (+) Transcript_45358:57-1922(+)
MKRKVDEAIPRLTPYEFSKDFPPRNVGRDEAATARWFVEVFGAQPLLPEDPTMTIRERHLYTLSASQYISMRRDGKVTCEEYSSALVKRARYYRLYNQWIYSSYDLFDKLIAGAMELDALAASKGVDTLAPLYGLPIPMKGTAAVIDYPSGSGSGVLSGYTPVKNSALTRLIIDKRGLIFGCTNVPEFAASYTTANPASGVTRNIYDVRFTVGGSSGGAASAVANYSCPIAISEDTGGSTRVPAACNQNFGFDPSRNHYNNEGNPGLTYSHDQLGLNARSIDDIILFDALLLDCASLHEMARQKAMARPVGGIRIGAPVEPFVHTKVRAGLHDDGPFDGLSLQPALKRKLDSVVEVLRAAGFAMAARAEWPSRHFAYLGREENVGVESLFSGEKINGRPISNFESSPAFISASGQMAQFVTSYLDAPVSIKEIVDDMGEAGKAHCPAGLHRYLMKGELDETQFRYFIGPRVAKDVEAYNSVFDEHALDLLLLPAIRCATPDLASLAGNTQQVERVDGSVENNSVKACFTLHAFAWKNLHIPKLVVPTGLTEDGRPTAVQLWGRALPYQKMFDDAAAIEHDAAFLQLVRRVVEAIQATPSLARANAPSVQGLWEAIGSVDAS